MKPYFTRRSPPADFIKLLRFSPEEQALTWLREVLPTWALEIHEDDLDRLVRGLIRAAYEIWDASNSPTSSLRFSNHVESLLKPSARLLEIFDHPDFEVFESKFSELWKLSLEFMRAEEIGKTFSYSGGETFKRKAEEDLDQFRKGLEAIESVVAQLKSDHEENHGKNKPRDDRRYYLAEEILWSWISMRLLAGSSLQEAIPTGRNGGFRWCYEALEALHKHLTVPPPVPHINYEDLNIGSEPPSPKVKRAIGEVKVFSFDHSQSIAEIVSERRDEMDVRTWSEESFQVMLRKSISELKKLSEKDFHIAHTDWQKIYIRDRLAFYIVSRSLNVVFSDELLDDGLPVIDLLDSE